MNSFERRKKNNENILVKITTDNVLLFIFEKVMLR